MTRKYSSISVEQLLDSPMGAADTTLELDNSAAVTALLGGVTLAAGDVDQFTIAVDPDTASEEIIFVRNTSGAQLTSLLRGQAGTSATTHTSGATVKHVLTSSDLDFYTTGVATANAAVTLTGTQTLTNKTISSGTLTGTLTAGGGTGTSGQFLQSTGTGVQWAVAGHGGKFTQVDTTSTSITPTTTQFNDGLLLNYTGSVSCNVTLPPSSGYDIGSFFWIRQSGVGQITILAGSGVTINNRYNQSGTKTSGQRAMIRAWHLGSSVWQIDGDVSA